MASTDMSNVETASTATSVQSQTASSSTTALKRPMRYIFDQIDHAHFTRSKEHDEILRFIGAINAAIADKPLSFNCVVAPVVANVVQMLHELSTWVISIPPLQQPMRYGNKAFRTWHEKLVREAVPLCRRCIHGVSSEDTSTTKTSSSSSSSSSSSTTTTTSSSSSSSSTTIAAPSSSTPPSTTSTTTAVENKQDLEIELAAYLVDSFGNPTRIDYGTGHETTFLLFLYALCKAGHLGVADLPALGLKAFPAYLQVCRTLQRTYWLEPAGSHGVWSLDDYHFLVFLFGSAQLLNHKHIKPRSIHTRDILDAYSKEYMYLGAISFISNVKVGAPFAEHSPMLNDIAELPTWGKVNEGLARMYKAEVLGKLPVVQHFTFGGLLPATWEPSRQPVPSDASARLYAYLDHEATHGVPSSGGGGDVLVEDEVPVDHAVTAVAPWRTEPVCTHPEHAHHAQQHVGSGSGNSYTSNQYDPTSMSSLTGVAPWANVNNNNNNKSRTPTSSSSPTGSVSGSGGIDSAVITGSSFHKAFGQIPHILASSSPGGKGVSSPKNSPKVSPKE